MTPFNQRNNLDLPTVTVWTKSNCVQCETTKRTMDKLNVPYVVADLEANPKQAAEFVAQGLLAAPIVVTDTKIWSGFRLPKIQSLAKYIDSIRAAE